MRKIISVALVLLMALPILPLSAVAGENATSENYVTESRQGEDLFDTYPQNWQYSMYPGYTNDFYLWVQNTYDGEYFVGTMGTPWDYDYLFHANVTFDAVTYRNHQVVPNSPIIWQVSDVYNNGGNGNTLCDYCSYNYWNNTGNWLSFTLNPNNMPTGEYSIRVKMTAEVVTDYDGVSVYTFATHYEYEYFDFEIYPAFYYNNVYGFDDYYNTEPIYAGADHQKIGLDVGNYIGGNFQELTATLTIADNHFTILNKDAKASYFGNWPDFMWIVNVAKGTPANYYQASCTFSYRLDGTMYTETTKMYFNITVQWTPLIALPATNGVTTPLVTLVQHSQKSNFTVPIKNDGNVALDDLMLRLDLDRAGYFVNGQYYRHEGNWGNLYAQEITVSLGTLNVGESKQAVFPAAMIRDQLPPGIYLIPVDYMANYLDTGVIGYSDTRMTGYYDEWGYYTYSDIHSAIDYPMPQSNNYPFIVVEVVDDVQGIQVTGEISGIWYPNQKNCNMYMTVTNFEMYNFNTLWYTIHTDGGSPIKKIGVPDTDPSTTLTPIRRWNLYGSSTDGFYFYTDMRQIVSPGTHYIQVDVEAYNPNNQIVRFSFDAVLIVSANSPTLELLRWSSELGLNQTAKVTVMVENVGWGGATNVSAFFRSSNSQIVSVDAPQMIGTIKPGTVFNYTFTVKPSNDGQAIWGNWAGYVYFEFMDDGGNIRKLFTTSSIYVNYIIQPKLPYLAITNVVSPGVNPGSKLNVVVTIANLGGSTAYATQVIWSDTQSLFGIDGASTFTVGDLAPGATATVTMVVKASKAVLPGTTYYAYLYVSYKRVDGFGMTFNEGGSRSFTFHTMPEVVPSKQIVEHQDSGYSFDIGYMMLGIFIMIAIVVGVSLYKKPAPIQQYEPKTAEPVERTPPGPPK